MQLAIERGSEAEKILKERMESISSTAFLMRRIRFRDNNIRFRDNAD